MVNVPGLDVPGPRALGVLDLDAIVDSTRCPVCRSVLAATTCGSCGADLTGVAARRVWDLSRQIVTAATERATQVRVLGEEAVQRRAAQARPAPPPAVPVPPVPVPPVPGPTGAVPPASPAVPPAVPPPFAPPAGPVPARRQGLGVQGVLVGLGALLLAVAAIVFLAFAWNAMGIGGRAAVVGGVTLAALAGAAALRPRLEATGEAVGALAAVLVLADVWAVRRTGLLGADDVDAFLYSGAGLAVAALVLGGWALRWRVRAGSVVASLVLPVAALLLGLATTGPQGTARGLGLGLVLAALATAVRGLLPRAWSAERVLLRLGAAAGLLVLPVAALVTYLDDGNLGVALLAAGTVAAGLQATVELRAPAPVPAPRGPATIRSLWSAAAGGYLATVAAVGAARVLDAVDSGTSPVYVVPVAAVGLALVLVALATPGLERVGVRGRPAALAVEVVGGLVLSVEAAVVATAALGPAFAAVSGPWRHTAGESLASVAPDASAYTDRPGLWQTVLVASCAALLVATAALVVGHRVRPETVGAEAPWVAPLLAGGGAVGLVCAPRLMVGAAVGALVLLAVLTTVVRLRVPALAGQADAGPGARATALSLRVVAAGAGALAVVDAWSVPALSVPLTVLGVVALLAARPAVTAGAGPLLVGAASVAATVAAGGAAGLLDRSVADRFTTAGVAAALLVVLAQALAWATARPAPASGPDVPQARGLLARPSTVERLAVTAAGALVGGVSLLAAVAGGGGADGEEPARLAVVLGALLLAAVVTALAPVRAVGPGADPVVLPVVRGTRLAAAGAVPALAGATAVALVERFGSGTDGVVALRGLVLAAAAAAAALALAGLLAARRATVRDPRRPAVEAGVVVVALAAGICALADPVAARAWVTLMLLGAAASAVAVADDRRPVGWPAWVLLTASTWVRLDLGDVRTLEAYTLPPAAALLAVAALRVRRERGAAVWRVLAPGAGLALGPSVLASAGGGDLRPWVLLAVGAGLVAAGLLPDGGTPRTALLHRVGRVLTIAGAAAALGPGLRTAVAVSGAAQDAGLGASSLVRAVDVERWSLPAAVVVLAATVVLAGRHRAFTGRLAGLALVPALVVLTAPSWAAAAVVRWDGAPRLVAGDAATAPTVARLLGALAVLVVVAVVAAARRGADPATPAGVLLTWPLALVAAAGAALVALTGYRVLDVPVEAFTVTSGALAVVLGALRLRAVPALRSWPALGPGLLLALVPTLVLAADGALWRIVGLVVVAAAVVAAGAARRLQAAVVVGALVLVGHAVVQLAPYVADLTTSQWRWVVFAVVGAGLLALGATYERQLVRLRLARTRVSALR